MSDLNKVAPAQAGPAPSPNLLDEFAHRGDRMRAEAGNCKVTASASAEAAQEAERELADMTARYNTVSAELERIRREAEELARSLTEQQQAMDRHRQRAAEHEKKAAELLNDAAYLDEVVARAPRRFPNLAPQCICVMPGAPNAAARAAACPVHSTAAANGGPNGAPQ
jgi:septal ring factor EnvC (AmiA/AmiB activator)